MHHLSLPSTLLALALPLLSQYALPTLANTEIINFEAGKPVPVAPLSENWTVLHAGSNEIIVRDRTPAPLRGSRHESLCDDDEDEKDVDPFVRQICPHELWLALDLDGDFVGHGEGKGGGSAAWKGHYNRFTLRVSWPASHPVQVSLSLHHPTPPPYPSSMSSVPSVCMSRLHFARIRFAQEGVRLPHNAEEHTHTEHKGSEAEEGAVPLVVILEPLVLGVLPASILPVVSTLLVGVLGLLGLLGATGTGPGVWRELGEVVEKARKELAVVEEGKEKKEK